MAKKHLNSTHCALIMALLVSCWRQNTSSMILMLHSSYPSSTTHLDIMAAHHTGFAGSLAPWMLQKCLLLLAPGLIHSEIRDIEFSHLTVPYTHNHLEWGKNVFQHFSAFPFTWYTISLSCIKYTVEVFNRNHYKTGCRLIQSSFLTYRHFILSTNGAACKEWPRFDIRLLGHGFTLTTALSFQAVTFARIPKVFSFLSGSIGGKKKYEKMINLNSQATGLSLCLQHKT